MSQKLCFKKYLLKKVCICTTTVRVNCTCSLTGGTIDSTADKHRNVGEI